MSTYQLYLFDADHRLLHVMDIEGGSDEEAAGAAEGHAAGHAAEIWRDGRFVRRIEPRPITN